MGAKAVQVEPYIFWQNLSQSEFLEQPSTTAGKDKYNGVLKETLAEEMSAVQYTRLHEFI